MASNQPHKPDSSIAGMRLDKSRRDFLKQSSLFTAIALTPVSGLQAVNSDWDEKVAAAFEKVPLKN